MFRNVLFLLLSAMPLLCPAKSLVNFADPLEAIPQVRNGKIQIVSPPMEFFCRRSAAAK